ncbi:MULTISPECIES: hypothetical protein [unclassified Carboxylicivirga]|uniref:hypothetical protein n=1 Tax=Carboxylicivirga TaxID=1628153 RepID=UPI003D33B777
MKNKDLELREQNLMLREKELELRIELFEARAPKVKVIEKTMKRRTVAKWFFFLLSISAIAPIALPYIEPELFQQYKWMLLAQLIMFLYLHWLASGKIKTWVYNIRKWFKRGIERAKDHERERKKAV